MHESEKWKWSLSVVSDSSWPREGQPTRLLCPWNFPGKSTGVDCHCLLHDTVQYIPNLWNCISTKLQVYLNILLCCNTLQIVSFPGGSTGKESTFNVGDLDFIPGLGRSPGEEKGYPFQCSVLENSMDCRVHGVSKSQTWLSNFHFLHFCRLSLFNFILPSWLNFIVFPFNFISHYIVKTIQDNVWALSKLILVWTIPCII